MAKNEKRILRRSKPLFFVWGVIILFSLLACSTTKLDKNNSLHEKNVLHSDTSAVKSAAYQDYITHDSIVYRDSVVVRTQNDTIYVDRWHNVLRWRNVTKNKRDTLTQYVTRYNDIYVKDKDESVKKLTTSNIVPWWIIFPILFLLYLGYTAFKEN